MTVSGTANTRPTGPHSNVQNAVARMTATYDSMRDKAVDLGQKAAVKAGQLKDQALKKVEEMKTDMPKKP